MEGATENTHKKSDVTVDQNMIKSPPAQLSPVRETSTTNQTPKRKQSSPPLTNVEHSILKIKSEPMPSRKTDHCPRQETPIRQTNLTPQRDRGLQVEPIVSRPFQFPPNGQRDLHRPPPLHPLREMYYQHLLNNSNPMLPYLPFYQTPFQPAPQSPSELNLSLLRLPPSPGPLPPSPNYLTAEYIARNFSFNRNQL
eukprot:TRINITY_DN67540_c0_g1_i1.p1 TRINITY_DN67540_c0_g1~~TRINITY_DN67540_c0_g1_i1.p1  ORF type:complete len:212 (-),score=48.80 TRINITY_DN67540_c0_g1_i1:59-646(-)